MTTLHFAILNNFFPDKDLQKKKNYNWKPPWKYVYLSLYSLTLLFYLFDSQVKSQFLTGYCTGLYCNLAPSVWEGDSLRSLIASL